MILNSQIQYGIRVARLLCPISQFFSSRFLRQTPILATQRPSAPLCALLRFREATSTLTPGGLRLKLTGLRVAKAFLCTIKSR